MQKLNYKSNSPLFINYTLYTLLLLFITSTFISILLLIVILKDLLIIKCFTTARILQHKRVVPVAYYLHSMLTCMKNHIPTKIFLNSREIKQLIWCAMQRHVCRAADIILKLEWLFSVINQGDCNYNIWEYTNEMPICQVAHRTMDSTVRQVDYCALFFREESTAQFLQIFP